MQCILWKDYTMKYPNHICIGKDFIQYAWPSLNFLPLYGFEGFFPVSY